MTVNVCCGCEHREAPEKNKRKIKSRVQTGSYSIVFQLNSLSAAKGFATYSQS